MNKQTTEQFKKMTSDMARLGQEILDLEEARSHKITEIEDATSELDGKVENLAVLNREIKNCKDVMYKIMAMHDQLEVAEDISGSTIDISSPTLKVEAEKPVKISEELENTPQKQPETEQKMSIIPQKHSKIESVVEISVPFGLIPAEDVEKLRTYQWSEYYKALKEHENDTALRMGQILYLAGIIDRERQAGPYVGRHREHIYRLLEVLGFVRIIIENGNKQKGHSAKYVYGWGGE